MQNNPMGFILIFWFVFWGVLGRWLHRPGTTYSCFEASSPARHSQRLWQFVGMRFSDRTVTQQTFGVSCYLKASERFMTGRFTLNAYVILGWKVWLFLVWVIIAIRQKISPPLTAISALLVIAKLWQQIKMVKRVIACLKRLIATTTKTSFELKRPTSVVFSDTASRDFLCISSLVNYTCKILFTEY